MEPQNSGGSRSPDVDPAGSFEFSVHLVASSDHAATVEVHGELDVSTAPKLQDRLHDLITEGKRDLIVDLAGMTFIDSTGLGVLVSALKRAREAGGGLVLREPRPSARKVFEISGLAQIVDIVS